MDLIVSKVTEILGEVGGKRGCQEFIWFSPFPLQQAQLQLRHAFRPKPGCVPKALSVLSPAVSVS